MVQTRKTGSLSHMWHVYTPKGSGALMNYWNYLLRCPIPMLRAEHLACLLSWLPANQQLTHEKAKFVIFNVPPVSPLLSPLAYISLSLLPLIYEIHLLLAFLACK